MKIEGRKSQQFGSIGPISVPVAAELAPVEEATPPAAGDSVDITAAHQLHKLQEAVQAMPAVRMEKVEGLRGAIEDGSYYVESEKLARKVVDDTLTEALLQKGRGNL